MYSKSNNIQHTESWANTRSPLMCGKASSVARTAFTGRLNNSDYLSDSSTRSCRQSRVKRFHSETFNRKHPSEAAVLIDDASQLIGCLNQPVERI